MFDFLTCQVYKSVHSLHTCNVIFSTLDTLEKLNFFPKYIFMCTVL